MPWNAQAPEEYCHLLYPSAQWLCCLQEVCYSCCTFRKIAPQISKARKAMFWWHLNILSVITKILNVVCVCMYPMSHKMWAMSTGVKESSQDQQVEQLFQYLCALVNLFLMRERGVFCFVLFSFFPGFYALVWFVSPSVDINSVSAREYLQASAGFQKSTSYSEPSYFAVKFHVSDGFLHAVAKRWR